MLPPEDGDPPLAAVNKRFAGRTIEEALHAFEEACSDENFQGVVIEECIERADGVLVRYEVRWKVSVFDDHAYGRHVSWALLSRANAGADGIRFGVIAASTEHHIP